MVTLIKRVPENMKIIRIFIFRHIIHYFQDFFIWENSQDPYTCKLGAPKKGSKFGGMKSFVTYPITPDFSNIQVISIDASVDVDDMKSLLPRCPGATSSLIGFTRD